jgi:hypothetical protein
MCVMWVHCPHYPQDPDTAVYPVATAGNLLCEPTEAVNASQRRDFIVSGCSEKSSIAELSDAATMLCCAHECEG